MSASLTLKKSPDLERALAGCRAMQDHATSQAIQLVSRPEGTRLTITDHRLLRQLASQASEEARREYWPRIWGEFAENFDPR